MEIQANKNYVKMNLPNGTVVDVLSPVLDEIRKWLQDDLSKPESGGYIMLTEQRKKYCATIHFCRFML